MEAKKGIYFTAIYDVVSLDAENGGWTLKEADLDHPQQDKLDDAEYDVPCSIINNIQFSSTNMFSTRACCQKDPKCEVSANP